MTLDENWRYTYVNEAAAAFLKTKPTDVLGKVIWEAFPHLRDSRFHKEFLRAAQEKTFVQVEDYYEPQRRWYECRCHPTKNGLAVFLNDATRHKKIEQAMLESRQVLEMAVAGSNAGIWRIDLNPEKPGYMPDHAYWSPQLKALIGFESDEFPNSRSAWQERIVPEDRPRLDEAARAHAEGRTDTYQVDYRIRHRDGSLRWLSRRGRLYRDEFNRPLRWTGADTDITDRKEAEETMRRLKQQAERAAEQARWLSSFPEENPNPTFRVSNDHVMLYSNPAAERLCEYWGCWRGQKVPPVVQEIIADTLDAEKVTNHEILCGDHTFWLTVAPCPAEKYVNIFVRDITESRRMAESLRQANERLQEQTEELQTQQEKLQSQAEELQNANEELQTANEELQLQREELEAANEEFQAQQEELRTQTEELQSQAMELRESERRFHTMADAIPQLAWIARADGWIHWYNRRWYEYTGTTARQMEGWGWQSVHDPKVLPEVMERWKASIARGEPFDMTFPLRGADGRFRDFLTRGVPLKDEQGRVVQWFGTNTDITAMKEAETALRQSEEQFRVLTQNLHSAVALIDERGAFSVVNDSFRRMFDIPQDADILNINSRDWGRWQVFDEHGELLDVDEHPVRKAALARSVVRDQLVAVKSPSVSDLKWLLVSAEPILDARGDVHRLICTYYDITDRKAAEEALHRSEARWNAAIESFAEGAIIATEDEQVIYWNPAAREMHGFTRPDEGIEPLEETPVTFQLWTPDGSHMLRLDEWPMRRIKRGETVRNLELRIRRPDQGWEKIFSYSGAMVDTVGGERLIFLTCSDLTELRQAEQALWQSEQRFRLALEAGRMGLWEWEVNGDACVWDQRVYELLGLDPSTKASHQAFLQHVDPQDVKAFEGQIQASLAEGGNLEAEFRVVRCDGETLWVTSCGRTIRDAFGKPVRRVGILYDITPRKQMEEQLRRLNDQLEEEVRAQTEELRETVERLQDEVVRRVLAEGKFRKQSQMLEGFFQHTITPLAFLDQDFNFVRVNEAYARADGKTPEFFKGKNHFELYPHEENQAIFEVAVRTGKPYRARAKAFIYPDRPQRVTYWDWQLTPLRNDRGEVQYLVLNLQDVTHQQQVLRELESRALQLQKLTLELSQAENRERRRMAEVLHDGLQQQLAAAKFHLGLLSSRARADATTQEIAGQLDNMLRDAIEQSRSLSHDLSPAVLYQSDLGETFEWLARQVQTKHGMTVHTEVHGHVDSSSESIKAFLFRTGQEILFNAVKHAQVPEVRLRLQRRRDYLWLTIADHGRGFDPATLGVTAGFGLLSIRERVGLLGGRMKIRSVPSRGSVFLIAVPDAQLVEEATPTGDSEQTRAGKPVGSGRRSAASGGRLRVLLVDDHKVMREGLAALIEEERDMEIIGQAGDGGEAVELARMLQPDVVVMDVAMPVMPGDEATRRIKAERPETRVVALSMFAEPGVSEKMLDAGADIYLPKTGPSGELLAAIRGSDQ